MKALAVAAAVAALGLAGCAPSSTMELKQQSQPITFTVDKPYQRVFKEARDEFERCVSSGWIFGSAEVDSQLYPDLGEGEVSITHDNMGDRSVFLSIDFSESEGATTVTAYSSDVGKWDGSDKRYQDFAQHGSPFCD